MDREEERQRLRAEEEKEQELRRRGVYVPQLNAAEQKTLSEILNLAAIAKAAAKTEIAVKAFRNGQLIEVVEPVGNEDLIFQALLYRMRQSGAER